MTMTKKFIINILFYYIILYYIILYYIILYYIILLKDKYLFNTITTSGNLY
jgi:hypothetical protein